MSFRGPLNGAVTALRVTMALVSSMQHEPWFEGWANHSNVGVVIPNLTLQLDRAVRIDPPPPVGTASVPLGANVAGLAAVGAGGLAGQACGFTGLSDELLLAAAAAMTDKTLGAEQVAAVLQHAMAGQASAMAGQPAAAVALPGLASPEAHAALAQATTEIQLQQVVARATANARATAAQVAATAAAPSANVLVAVKLLLSDREAAIVAGENDSMLQDIQSATGTNLRLAREGYYPGSELLELTIQGMSTETLLLSLVHISTLCVDLLGSMPSGDDNNEVGAVRMKLVMPAKAAASVIGVGGANVKAICAQCSVRIQVDQSPVPCGGGSTEQAVLCCGNAAQVQSSLPLILQHVAMIAAEKDILTWAATSNAGTKIPGLILFTGYKGTGTTGKGTATGHRGTGGGKGGGKKKRGSDFLPFPQ